MLHKSDFFGWLAKLHEISPAEIRFPGISTDALGTA